MFDGSSIRLSMRDSIHRPYGSAGHVADDACGSTNYLELKAASRGWLCRTSMRRSHDSSAMVDVTGAYQERKKKPTPRTYFHGSAICTLISLLPFLILTNSIHGHVVARRDPKPHSPPTAPAQWRCCRAAIERPTMLCCGCEEGREGVVQGSTVSEYGGEAEEG